MRGGGTLVVKAEDLTIKSIERSEVEERVRVENEVIHFDDYDEYATYTLTLENPTSTKLQVTNINLTNNECVNINTNNLNNTIVEPNSTKEVTLTLTSNKCNVNQDNTALLSFKSKEYTEDKTEEKEDIVSPNTYGNISVFLVVLFILTAIYISLYIYSRKKPFKYIKLSTIIYLSLLVLTTITYTIMTSFSANEESLSLTFSYTYKPRRVLMRRDRDEEESYWEDLLCKDEGTFWEDWNIKNINIQNNIEEPDEYEEVYDASMNQDESILVYKVVNSDDDNYYDLYMMADGVIFTNVDSSWLFGGFSDVSNFNGAENLNTAGTENMKGMFYNLGNWSDNIELIKINTSSWDTSNVTDMSEMFYSFCSNESLDLSHFNTSKVTDMSEMFVSYSSSQPLIISNFDTSNVTDMSEMFWNYSSSSKLDLSHLDTSKVTDMSYMFRDYRSNQPLDLSSFDTSSVITMQNMFDGYSSSAPLDLSSFDTSNVTDMSNMFLLAGNKDTELTIDVSNFNTSKVTNMTYMFAFKENATVNIRGLNNLDTSKVTNMSYMLINYNSSTPLDLSFLTINEGTDIKGLLANYGSTAVLDLSKLDISKVTSLQELFAGYKSNQPLDLSYLDISNVNDMERMFAEWNSTADLDISGMTFTTLPQTMFGNKKKANKIYVANDTVKNLLKNSGWPYMTDANIIVGSCEEGVCHSN